MSERIQGTVVKFDKTFGFIRPDGESDDIFCHFTDIQGEGYKVLEVGQRVEFEYGFRSGKRQANNITILNGGGPNAED